MGNQDNSSNLPYRQTERPAMPRSLMEVVEALDGSGVLRDGFGDRFVDHFLLISYCAFVDFLNLSVYLQRPPQFPGPLGVRSRAPYRLLS